MERTIEAISKRAIPIAIQQTLTRSAQRTSTGAKGEILKKFTIRNKWTVRSVRYDRAEGLDVDTMASKAGSAQRYMAKQEDGFSTSGKLSPTGDAAGQPGAQKRTAAVRARFNRVKASARGSDVASLRNRRHPDQKRIASIIDARRRGDKFWYGQIKRDNPDTRGVWQLKGGRLGKKGGWPKGMKTVKVYNDVNGMMQTTATPWLEPATVDALRKQGGDYVDALDRQLKRLKASGRA
jgi:hypothetical protein